MTYKKYRSMHLCIVGINEVVEIEDYSHIYAL
jgi:hypothetical protein